MRVSLNWVKEFTEVKISVDDLVAKIGAQLGAVEEVVDLGKKYNGVVVAKVVSCQKHPNADKLHVCMIDDGRKVKGVKRDTKGNVQVVCGAPNVKAGMFVAWIPPGATVPSSVDNGTSLKLRTTRDPFILDTREIRGIVSNGMLASPHELALGDDHDGILELNELEVAGRQSPVASKKLALGIPFKELFGLDDYIIDIENKMFTHRPDLFGQLGVAREIAGIQGLKFQSPDWYSRPVASRQSPVASHKTKKLELRVENLVPKLCPRYMAVAIDNIQIKPSPVWLQSYLSRVGIRPINNIVDTTNYLMMLSAQPLHAFDYDKVAVDNKVKIVVRSPKKGEKMTLLDGKEIQPRQDAILICDQAKPIALGGVMGGNNSEIDQNTKRIIIESANFDMYNIRKTSMEYGLFSDAATRFIKGQTPQQCAPVLYKAIQMVEELCPESAIIRPPIDNYRKSNKVDSVAITADFINQRLGTSLSIKEIASLLEKVEFKLMSVPADKKRIHILPPFWRTDIKIAEDVVEEVGRLHGYDHLPLELPKRSIRASAINQKLAFKDRLRDILSRAGANEVLTYSFVHGNLIGGVGQNRNNAFKLSNALSPDLQYYRLSLLPSLLDKVHPNIKAGYDEFALFEINPIHTKDFVDTKTGLPIEDIRLALVFASEDKLAKSKYTGAPYYRAKKYLIYLLESLGVEIIMEPANKNKPETKIGKAALAPFELRRAAYVKTSDGLVLAELGEFKKSARKNLKLPMYCAGFELDVNRLMKHANKNTYVALPKFPKVEQDISLKVKADMPYAELYEFIREEIGKNQTKNCWWTLRDVDIYQREDDTKHKQVTLRLTIASHQRTLTTEEVNTLLDTIAEAAKEKHGAERI